MNTEQNMKLARAWSSKYYDKPKFIGLPTLDEAFVIALTAATSELERELRLERGSAEAFIETVNNERDQLRSDLDSARKQLAEKDEALSNLMDLCEAHIGTAKDIWQFQEAEKALTSPASNYVSVEHPVIANLAKAASQASHFYTAGLDDSNPAKGQLNYLADALAEFQKLKGGQNG